MSTALAVGFRFNMHKLNGKDLTFFAAKAFVIVRFFANVCEKCRNVS